MSEKEYDPQYETKVPHFNKDIACEWVRNNENDRINNVIMWRENCILNLCLLPEFYYSGEWINGINNIDS